VLAIDLSMMVAIAVYRALQLLANSTPDYALSSSA
jgi:hypothetical protein